MVGELERALESAGRDALIEHFAVLLFLRGVFLAVDGQHVFLHFEVEFLVGEAGDGDGNTVGIFAGTLDIVGRITGNAAVIAEGIEKRKHAVETDGGTIKRAKIETGHDISSIEATCSRRPAKGRAARS